MTGGGSSSLVRGNYFVQWGRCPECYLDRINGQSHLYRHFLFIAQGHVAGEAGQAGWAVDPMELGGVPA